MIFEKHELIKIYKDKYGSFREVAKKTKIDFGQWYRWQRNDANMSLKTIQKLNLLLMQELKFENDKKIN